VLVDGPYLDVPVGCLSTGGLYGFTLRASDDMGDSSWTQVVVYVDLKRLLCTNI
jgi:hypothetical protein